MVTQVLGGSVLRPIGRGPDWLFLRPAARAKQCAEAAPVVSILSSGSSSDKGVRPAGVRPPEAPGAGNAEPRLPLGRPISQGALAASGALPSRTPFAGSGPRGPPARHPVEFGGQGVARRRGARGAGSGSPCGCAGRAAACGPGRGGGAGGERGLGGEGALAQAPRGLTGGEWSPEKAAGGVEATRTLAHPGVRRARVWLQGKEGLGRSPEPPGKRRGHRRPGGRGWPLRQVAPGGRRKGGEGPRGGGREPGRRLPLTQQAATLRATVPSPARPAAGAEGQVGSERGRAAGPPEGEPLTPDPGQAPEQTVRSSGGHPAAAGGGGDRAARFGGEARARHSCTPGLTGGRGVARSEGEVDPKPLPGAGHSLRAFCADHSHCRPPKNVISMQSLTRGARGAACL